jgi:hypothetical protein
MGKVLSLLVAGSAAAVAADGGFAFTSTAGCTADSDAGVGAGAAGAFVRVVVARVVTVRAGVAAGLVAVVRVERLVVVIVAMGAASGVVAAVSAAGVLDSVVVDVASMVGGGSGVVVGTGSITGCVCGTASWAKLGVEESARAAAIAGRALARA